MIKYKLCTAMIIKGRVNKFEQCTEVHFVSFLSGGIITAIAANPTEKETGKTHLCAV